MGGDFGKGVVRGNDFLCFSEERGYSENEVIISKNFEKDVAQFSAKKLSELGLFDGQFVDAMPDGDVVGKYILPLVFAEGSAFSIVDVEPNVVVKKHSHTKGFLRLIFSGEFTFTGLPCGEVELSSGDWIYIPPNQEYGYRTGLAGGRGGCSYCTGGGGGQCGPRVDE